MPGAEYVCAAGMGVLSDVAIEEEDPEAIDYSELATELCTGCRDRCCSHRALCLAAFKQVVIKTTHISACAY